MHLNSLPACIIETNTYKNTNIYSEKNNLYLLHGTVCGYVAWTSKNFEENNCNEWSLNGWFFIWRSVFVPSNPTIFGTGADRSEEWQDCRDEEGRTWTMPSAPGLENHERFPNVSHNSDIVSLGFPRFFPLKYPIDIPWFSHLCPILPCFSPLFSRDFPSSTAPFAGEGPRDFPRRSRRWTQIWRITIERTRSCRQRFFGVAGKIDRKNHGI